MDNNFHLQQGQVLLNKGDAASIKKAIEHFVIANKMTDNGDVGKPLTLYYLGYGNLILGNVERAYLIANKAQRAIVTSKKQSIISLTTWPGEDKVNELIELINKNFDRFIKFTDIDNDDFDENDIDFSKLYKLHPLENNQSQVSDIIIEDLDDEIIMATFSGLGRTDDELVYFDKEKGDVLSYVQGYFSSHLGDQDSEGRKLTEKIINHSPIDYIDDNRYVLIDRLPLVDFLNEYKEQSLNKHIFKSYAEYFSVEILKDFHLNDSMTINDVACNYQIQERFHELFGQKYRESLADLRQDYTDIFESTCRVCAKNWLRTKLG